VIVLLVLLALGIYAFLLLGIEVCMMLVTSVVCLFDGQNESYARGVSCGPETVTLGKRCIT
jgi:hypothetical protein